jgi:hypothetical protein
MHKYLLLFICLLSLSGTYSQSLEGKWEGWYTFNNYKKDTAIIKLQFELNKDSIQEAN